jgi:hypothetical protein
MMAKAKRNMAMRFFTLLVSQDQYPAEAVHPALSSLHHGLGAERDEERESRDGR